MTRRLYRLDHHRDRCGLEPRVAVLAAINQSLLISVVVGGPQYAGQPDHIARLLVAKKAA